MEKIGRIEDLRIGRGNAKQKESLTNATQNRRIAPPTQRETSVTPLAGKGNERNATPRQHGTQSTQASMYTFYIQRDRKLNGNRQISTILLSGKTWISLESTPRCPFWKHVIAARRDRRRIVAHVRQCWFSSNRTPRSREGPPHRDVIIPA